MPAKNSPLTCYPSDETEEQFSELMGYYRHKHAGSQVKVTASYVMSEIIREKYVAVRNQETKSLTMQKVYDAVLRLEELVKQKLS